jgi:hypothetical protein
MIEREPMTRYCYPFGRGWNMVGETHLDLVAAHSKNGHDLHFRVDGGSAAAGTGGLADHKTLYVAASSSIYRIPLKVPGVVVSGDGMRRGRLLAHAMRPLQESKLGMSAPKARRYVEENSPATLTNRAYERRA